MKKDQFKRGVPRVEPMPVDPKTLPDPITPEDFLLRGMVFYARKQYETAIVNLQKAVALTQGFEDGYFALGMVYKAQQENEAAVKAFQKVIEILPRSTTGSQERKEMLRRLALGHINEITSGDWNLEKEIWVHVS